MTDATSTFDETEAVDLTDMNTDFTIGIPTSNVAFVTNRVIYFRDDLAVFAVPDGWEIRLAPGMILVTYEPITMEHYNA